MAVEWWIKIDEDGNASSSVTGIKGAGCKDLTRDYEKAMGVVVKDTPTREMHERETSREYNKNKS